MSGKPKDFLGAFLVGGLIGVVGQLFVELYTVLGLPPPMIPILMLASIALLSALLDIAGLFGKLTYFGGMGCVLPFWGLPPAVAMGFSAQLSEGKSTGKAVWAALKPSAIIFGIGYAVCFALALLMRAL